MTEQKREKRRVDLRIVGAPEAEPDDHGAGGDYIGGGGGDGAEQPRPIVGLNQAYEAVKRGDIPAITVGGRILPLKAPIDRMLGVSPFDTSTDGNDKND